MAGTKGGSASRVATETETTQQEGVARRKRVSPNEQKRRNILCNLSVSVNRGWELLGEEKSADSLIKRVWEKPAIELTLCLPRKTQNVSAALNMIVRDLQAAGGHNGHLESLRNLHSEVQRFGDAVTEIGRRLPQSSHSHKRTIMVCGRKIRASVTTLGIALNL